MRFIESIFGKDIKDISLLEVESFFNEPKEETDKMEFKSYTISEKWNKSLSERENDILRTICGFLNSEGGILIWGAPTNSRSEKYSGELTPFEKEYSKDQFMAIVANRIIPSPHGIQFMSIKVSDKFIYLFDVPKSEFPPHQFNDKYYMRMDGQTKAAPHHYIEAQFKKITFPNIEGYLMLESFDHLNKDLAVLKCGILFRNQSPFKNDYNLHYRVFTSHGPIIWYYEQPLNVFDKFDLRKPGDKIEKEVADTIYYGNWIDSRFQIMLSRSELYAQNYELDIRIQFGAKHSPMKMNVYHLVIGERSLPKLADHIVSMEENRFFNMYEETMNKSDKKRLRETLGR
jgi:hypothetical protein